MLREHRPSNNDTGQEFLCRVVDTRRVFRSPIAAGAVLKRRSRQWGNVRSSSPTCASTFRLRLRPGDPPRAPDGGQDSMPHVPWLLTAPPSWEHHGRSAETSETSPAVANRKRSVAAIDTTAETQLGKLACTFASVARSRGWKQLIRETRGPSNMAETVGSLDHKASRLLQHLRRRGAAVPLLTRSWTAAQFDEAVNWGAHQSAHGERELVCQEIMEFGEQGYWIVVPYSEARTWQNLRISPLGVVPQRDRRPHLIVDYSFSNLNNKIIALASCKAMQFGWTLQRVLTTIVHANPRYGPPVHMAKIDLADDIYYRVWVAVNDVTKLGVTLPFVPGHVPLVAFPLALPMRWVESPPYFTAVTETICDVANESLSQSVHPCCRQPHRLEAVAATHLADDDAPASKSRARPPPRRRLEWHIPSRHRLLQ